MTYILKNTRVGEVYPPRAAPPASPIDARTAGLFALKDYIAELTFNRPGDSVSSYISFQIARKDIHIEQPDNVVDVVFPSIAIEAGVANTELPRTGFYDESSVDVYGKGTVLWVTGEHQETVSLHIFGSKRAERRALLSGLENSFSPVEEIGGMTLVCPTYYDQVACFSVISTHRPDDYDSSLNRREGIIQLDMRINIVQLVNYTMFSPNVITVVETSVTA
jgi:hypothetical protein